MELNKSNLLIRDYENIRQILRDIYIFGCFSRDDFIEKNGISGRKYDKEQQRISAYLPQKFIQKRRVDKKVLLYCSYDVLDGAKNHLADTYRNKSFTVLDLMAYFLVQQLLNERGEMSASEILEELPLLNKDVIFTKDNLRVKLDELSEKGFICIKKEGRKVLYSLSRDIWADFDDEELVDICTYLEFMKNVSPIEMPYNFLYQKLCLYMNCERNIDIAGMEIFHFKHNHLFNLLDNDILLEILKARHGNYALRISFYNDKPDMIVVPGEIIHDRVYGRQYLYCYDKKYRRCSVIRIDHVNAVSIEKKLTTEEMKILPELFEYSKECWCTSGAGEELTEIVIDFWFDEEKEPFILSRIISEGHGGLIEKKNGVYEYYLKIKDPNEMIPWIRSFGERAKVVSSGEKRTELLILEDWKKVLEKYDSLR